MLRDITVRGRKRATCCLQSYAGYVSFKCVHGENSSASIASTLRFSAFFSVVFLGQFEILSECTIKRTESYEMLFIYLISQ